MDHERLARPPSLVLFVLFVGFVVNSWVHGAQSGLGLCASDVARTGAGPPRRKPTHVSLRTLPSRPGARRLSALLSK